MEAKFQAFLSRNKLESKPFQTECFKWCSMKEQAQQHQAQQYQAQHQAQQYQAQHQAQQYQAQQQQYQAQQHQEQPKKHGGILALEMGLGKTILMLGLVKCNLKQQTLIVLPRSLLDQWEKSIIQLCGCQPLVYHGSRPKSLKMPLAEIKTYPLVLTTYGQMSLPSVKQANKGRVRSRLHEIVWNRLICDEAHHVSHQKTNEFKGVQLIKAEICWLVTGTPLQNSEKELYNLYSLFGLSNSKVYYNTGENYTDTFKEMVFFRTKSGAGLVLPPLHEHTIHVEWANESEREFALHLHSLLTFCHVPQKSLAVQIEAETENVNALRMKYLSRAQQACVYPPMLERAIVHFERMLYEFRTGTSVAGTSADEYGDLDTSDIHVSQSKIDAILKTLVERKANGCGKIVFCRYYTEIDIIAERLRLADPTLRLAKFDGRVPNGKRASVLSEPVDILLAQIKMCREGLNLQVHYSEAYFPSPNFNPATEQQAIARCWRMGQQKEVHVFRYILGAMPPGPPLGVDAPETFSRMDERNPAAPLPPMGGVGHAEQQPPQTMDEFTTQLHVKKRELVDRMAIAAQTPLLPLRKIKIKYIKKS